MAAAASAAGALLESVDSPLLLGAKEGGPKRLGAVDVQLERSELCVSFGGLRIYCARAVVVGVVAAQSLCKVEKVSEPKVSFGAGSRDAKRFSPPLQNMPVLFFRLQLPCFKYPCIPYIEAHLSQYAYIPGPYAM